MKKRNIFLFGAIVGLLLGLWFGFNVGRDEPILSNPFSEPALKDKVKRTGEKVLEKTGEALEKGGKALKDQAE